MAAIMLKISKIWLPITIFGFVFKLAFLPAGLVFADEPTNEKKFIFSIEKIIEPAEPETVNIDVEISLSQAEQKQIAETENRKLAEWRRQQKALKQPTISRLASQPIIQSSSGNSEVDNLIDYYVNVYGVSEKADKIKKIVWCESKGDPNAKNRWSTAGGIAQYLDSSWSATAQGQAGFSKYNTQAATEALVTDVLQGSEHKWNASRSCWDRKNRL